MGNMEDLALGGIEVISHIISHFSKLRKSCWSIQLSGWELMARYIAKSLTLDLTCSDRSLKHARKRMGPRTEPC